MGRSTLPHSCAGHPSYRCNLNASRPDQYMVLNGLQRHDLVVVDRSICVLRASNLTHGRAKGRQEKVALWAFPAKALGSSHQHCLGFVYRHSHRFHGLASLSTGNGKKHELCKCRLWSSAPPKCAVVAASRTTDLQRSSQRGYRQYSFTLDSVETEQAVI